MLKECHILHDVSRAEKGVTYSVNCIVCFKLEVNLRIRRNNRRNELSIEH